MVQLNRMSSGCMGPNLTASRLPPILTHADHSLLRVVSGYIQSFIVVRLGERAVMNTYAVVSDTIL